MNLKRITFVNNSEPALNADNLNQLQTNTENAINELDTTITSMKSDIKTNSNNITTNTSNIAKKQDKVGTILYSNDTGTAGTVSLSQSLKDGDRLRITYFYSVSTDYKIAEVSYKEGRNYELNMVVRTDDTALYIFEKSIKLNSDNIIVNHEQRLAIWNNNIGGQPQVQITRDIYITEVELL